jgi:hypothetical protein
MSYIKMRDEWKLFIGWVVIVTLLLSGNVVDSIIEFSEETNNKIGLNINL